MIAVSDGLDEIAEQLVHRRVRAPRRAAGDERRELGERRARRRTQCRDEIGARPGVEHRDAVRVAPPRASVSIVVSPMPRFGTATARRNASSSAGLAMSLRYAMRSRISRRS